MSLVKESYPTEKHYWSYIGAEMQAILGGYKQHTFSHSNLNENDLKILEQANGFIDSALEKLEDAQNPMFIFRSKNRRHIEQLSISLEILLGLYPLKTPEDIKTKLTGYKDLVQNIACKKPLDREKLESAYLFFTKIAENGDLEAAKQFHSELVD